MAKTPPCESCNGHCCQKVPFSPREFRVVRRRHGIPSGAKLVRFMNGTMVERADGRCAYLGADFRCAVYRDRPLVCRLYGMIDELPCPLLEPEKARASAEALFDRAMDMVGKEPR